MKTNLTKILVSTAIVVCYTANGLAQIKTKSTMSTQQLNFIKQDLQQNLLMTKDQFGLIGLSLAVLLPGQQEPLTLTAGSSSINNKEPINPSSLFQVGSITKTFTAVLTIEAVNNKQLSLDDKLGKFFPEYAAWKDITISELLNQTSGIFDYVDSKDWWHRVFLSDNKIWEAKSLVNIAYQYPNKFPAGTKWSYSNTNYVLLGLVLEKVTHKSMDDLMSDLIRNANLQNTYYLPKEYPEKIARQMVHGYGFYDTTYDMTNQNGSIWHAAAAMISSPNDLSLWMYTLFAKNLINGFPVTHYLHLKSTKDGKNITTINQIGYDFGLFRMNTPEGMVWFTPGLTSGYISGMVYAPCLDLYFAYSTNKAPIKGLHKSIMMNILHIMNSNNGYKELLRENGSIPSYCPQIQPAKEFTFPLQ